MVINSVLSSGACNAGMSGGAQWQAFELSDEEYDSVVNQLESEGLRQLSTPTPEWVTSENEWMIWVYEVDHAVPSTEHRRLSAICEGIEKRINEAIAAGLDEEAENLHWQYVEADRNLQKFVDEHFKR